MGNQKGDTPLHLAAKSGNIDVVQALLDNGAIDSINMKNKHGSTPLHLAAKSGKIDVVQALLDNVDRHINMKEKTWQYPTAWPRNRQD